MNFNIAQYQHCELMLSEAYVLDSIRSTTNDQTGSLAGHSRRIHHWHGCEVEVETKVLEDVHIGSGTFTFS